MNRQKKALLFLCTGNSCRSQMAEGWARSIVGDHWIIRSAGVETHGLNQRAVTVMAEVGIDISDHQSKLIGDLDRVDFDYVVTVCDHASQNCPVFPGAGERIHQSFGDPPMLAATAGSEQEILECYRQVRDEIGQFVRNIFNELDNE